MRLILVCLCCFFSLSANELATKQTIMLYYAPYCPYCQQVLSYLKKIDKKIPMKNVKEDAQAKDELKRIGGVLEIPCLIVGDDALYRSDPIIAWLKEHKDELE